MQYTVILKPLDAMWLCYVMVLSMVARHEEAARNETREGQATRLEGFGDFE